MLGLSDVKTKEKAKQKLKRLGSKNGQKKNLENLRKTFGSMRSCKSEIRERLNTIKEDMTEE